MSGRTRRGSRRLGAALSMAITAMTVTSEGCAGTFDLAYWLVGNDGSDGVVELRRARGRTHERRRVALSANHGLTCDDDFTYEHASSGGEALRRDANGWLGTTIAGTIVDGAVLGVAAAVVESRCASGEDCSRDAYFYFIPSAASFLWGLYRSLTIEPSWYERASTYAAPFGPGTESVPCAPGTVIVLEGSGAPLELHVGLYGRLELGELPALRLHLARLVDAGIGTRLASAGLRLELDLSALEDLAAAGRAALAATATTNTPSTATPPTVAPAPATGTIHIEGSVTVP